MKKILLMVLMFLGIMPCVITAADKQEKELAKENKREAKMLLFKSLSPKQLKQLPNSARKCLSPENVQQIILTHGKSKNKSGQKKRNKGKHAGWND